MEEIKQKVQDLELALNYVCYDAELIPKLSKVWEKLELLQEVVNKKCNIPLVSVAVCPKCGCNKITGDGSKSWCLNKECDFIEAN